MGTVPRVALGLGSVAGLGAAHLAAAHYSVMVKDKSALFVAGPPVVERLGQKLTKNELGGWQIQLKAGAVDDAVDTEEEAFARRAALPLLPALVDRRRCRRAARRPTIRSAARSGCSTRSRATSASSTRCARSSRRSSTAGSFFEIAPLYGRAVITGLARLDGWPVAVHGERSLLLRRRLDGRHLPEGRALRRHRADLPPAGGLPRGLPGLPDRPRGRADRHHQAGRARDVGDLADDRAVVRGHHPQRLRRGGRGPPATAARYCTRYAWPSGRWGSLPLEGGIEAAYRADIDAARRSARPRWPRSRSGCNKLRSPFRSAETFWIEEIIDPRDTRPLLCEFAELAAPLREPGPSTHRMRP